MQFCYWWVESQAKYGDSVTLAGEKLSERPVGGQASRRRTSQAPTSRGITHSASIHR